MSPGLQGQTLLLRILKKLCSHTLLGTGPRAGQLGIAGEEERAGFPCSGESV